MHLKDIVPLARAGTLFATAILSISIAIPAFAAPRTWIGGNVDWVETAGTDANWSPNVFGNEPDAADEAIFNTGNSVNLGTNNSIQALTMSGGIDLLTDNFDLTVDGLVQLSGASTNLIINGAAGSVTADDVAINSGGVIELRGGLLTMDEEVGTALIDLNAGGVLQGNGTINFADNSGVAILMLVNDGTLTALSRGLTIFSPPPVGTLTISDVGNNGRLDLDGAGEAGVVNVNRNQTLATEMQLFDAFNGTLNLFHNSTFQFNQTFTLAAGGSIVVDNGFIAGGIGFSDILADVAYIDSSQLTQTGGTINVVDTDGTLQIDAPFTMSGGSFTNSGTVIFNGVTNITTAAGYDPPVLDAKTIINANFTVNDAAGNYDWDGNGQCDTTVNNGAQMSITANQVDTTDNVFGGTLTLNGGSDLTVNVAATSWTMGGSLVKNDAGTSDVSGDDVNITGSVIVNTGALSLPRTFLAAGSNVTVDGLLNIGTGSQLSGPALLTGSGTFRIEGGSTTTANTTVSVATFDWDGLVVGGSHSINSGVTLTINSPNFDTDGDMDDTIGMVGNGSQLIVNGPTQWIMRSTLNSNTSGIGTATIGGTSRMVLSGGSAVLNVDGSTIASAPVTFGASSTTSIDNATTLRLTGGNTTNNVNRIEGGVVSGLGILSADSGKALEGFGTINTDIDFDGASNLFADDGTLTINAPIVDVNRIGTADTDGVLNVVSAWNTSVTSFLQMSGGTIQGGTMTIDNVNSLSGFGTVTSRVINNTGIRANGGTLVLQTALNDNDWDGTINDAFLHANPNSTLELRDNATFGFTGTVSMFSGARVFTNGFALDFNPGSSLFLNSDAVYESTSSTDLGGVVTTSAGPASKIKVQNNFFLTFESTSNTTLVANLELENNNINIEAGATFSGTGALVIPDGSHVVLDNGANVNVLLANDGAFRPANFDGVGSVTVKDYQQGSTGELYIEIAGTLLNQYDRLLVSGNAVLDGYLNLDIDGGFVPALGNTFDIISTMFGRSGTFDTVDVSGMPAGLTFHVDYLDTKVRLTVVNKPNFAADFDDDGDVDLTDLAIWRGALNLNQLGDANGDNQSNAADWVIWRDEFGSAPGAAAVLDANGAAVPEPGTLGIVMLAAWGAVFQRRRRTVVTALA